VRTPRALTIAVACALLGLLGVAFSAGSAAAADPDGVVILSSSAKRAEFEVVRGGVELRLHGVRPAIGLGSDLSEPGDPGIGPRQLAAAVGRGSVLTVELYGVSRWKDSLSLAVDRVRAEGRQLVVRGRRIDRGRELRVRHSFNAPDRALPARMRGAGLVFDTDPGGGPVTGLDGLPAPRAVMAIGAVPTRRPLSSRPFASASDSAPEHEVIAVPGDTAKLFENGVETARFGCEVAGWSGLPLTVVVQSTFANQSAKPFEGQLSTPRTGETLAFKPVPVAGESAPYRATVDVSVRYPSPIFGSLSLDVRPVAPSPAPGGPWIVAVCTGSAYGGPPIGSGYGQTVEPEFQANGIEVGDAEPTERGPRDR